jgi:hypothetical protein
VGAESVESEIKEEGDKAKCEVFAKHGTEKKENG